MMSSAAKGCFPGRPRKKIEKRKVKFQPQLHKQELDDLKVTCSFITNISRQFHVIFKDNLNEDGDFLGFPTEDVSAVLSEATPRNSGDLQHKSTSSRQSRKHTSSRRSLQVRRNDSTSAADRERSSSSTDFPLSDTASGSSRKKSNSRDGDGSSGSWDSAFLKYNSSKLDFHRLSRKARIKDEPCSAEEKAKLMDTSVASLKYASYIYLAKSHGAAAVVKSPIKPATFIPPISSKRLHVSAYGETSLVIRSSKTIGRLGRRSQSEKSLEAGNSPMSVKHRHSKSPKTFVLPTKSARSSRIIKANRKYLDAELSPSTKATSREDGHSARVPGMLVSAECSVNIPRMSEEQVIAHESPKSKRSSRREDARPLTAKRRPLIKEPTFRIKEQNVRSRSTRRHKDDTHAHVKRLIKRARFNHTDAALHSSAASESRSRSKQIIKQAIFKAPWQEKHAVFNDSVLRPPKEPIMDDSVLSSGLGLSVNDWKQLTCPLTLRDRDQHDSQVWTGQEVHNILHGAHTFGAAWASIARQYEFLEVHRDWLSVRNKGVKCRGLGLLDRSYKVSSTIMVQLKPKFSCNPNITVFTPGELKARGLERNVICDDGSTRKLRVRGPCTWRRGNENTAAERGQLAQNALDPTSSGANAFDKDDLYLGLTEKEFKMMLRPRLKKTQQWTTWEIHNVLHGIHWFGVGAWQVIFKMYKFLSLHDNLAIRARFKTVCNRGLIVNGGVRTDVIPKLRPILSKHGKSYFKRHKFPIPCSATEDDAENTDPQECETSGAETLNRRRSQASTGIRRRRRPGKQRREVYNNEEDGNDTALSPPRKQAIHLFGTAPVWDDGAEVELDAITSDDESTPVLQALEDGLRKNSSPDNETAVTSSVPFDSEVTVATTVDGRPRDKLSSSQSADQKASQSLPKQPQTRRTRKNSVKTKESTTEPKVTGKGPRIKHVCRRASLVTGQTKATYGDDSPQLSALPKDEREKIAAQAEKLKENTPLFTSSESEEEHRANHRSTSSTANAVHTVSRKEKNNPSKKRTLAPARCGKCDACTEPACGECDACRKAGTGGERARCLRLKACIQQAEQLCPQVKKARKAPVEHQQGSRQSTRLKQQKVPLMSSNVVETTLYASSCDPLSVGGGTGHPVSSSLKTSVARTNALKSSSLFDSPLHEHFSPQKQAIVKLDNWKETYDIDLLWKYGGHALITSQPPPPRTVCFLCGSLGITSGLHNRLVYCACCCEPFHTCCADERYYEPRIADVMLRGTWVCRRCRHCHVCGQTKDLQECRHCGKTYHSECLGPSYPTKASSKGVWVCIRCVRCQSCGASKPGNLPGSEWTHDFTMCQRCGDLYDKGNFCPICQRCYSDEDFDTRMVQCAGCKRWVHSKCENLTVEMYTLLSHLPDNVQYKCPDCDSRGAKAKKMLEEVQKDDEANKRSPSDAENIRRVLSQLPAPPWMTTIEKEIQSGLEAITMALFHNRATYCILKMKSNNSDETHSSGAQIDDDDKLARPRDLFAVRFAVHNARYKSLAAFCADVRSILESVPNTADRAAVETAFKEEAGSVFPWFNFESGKIRDSDDVPENLLPNATMPPAPEHDYAQWQDKDIHLDPVTPNSSPLKSQGSNTPSQVDAWSLPSKSTEDLRQCVFCSKYGDDKPAHSGRLLHCGQDEWCHVNCALWSAEVYEQHDGSLQYVHSAASRGKMMKCEYCKLPGATVGCCTRDCPMNYHFMCARVSNCSFQEDKNVFCRRHGNHAKKTLVIDDQFEVDRLLCVDNDEMRPTRRWQRGVQASNVTITIGSLTVHQLGRLGLASDSRECLVPVCYRITRVFWSTFAANRKTIYTITVSERRPSCESPDKDKSSENNTTISHFDEEEERLDSRRHSEAASSKDRLSPPTTCKTNLIDRLESPGIGPLSPTRRPTSHLRVNAARPIHRTGTYTVLSDINRTLPQVITPVPSISDVIASSSSSSNATSVASVSVSPGNPFLNLSPPAVCANPAIVMPTFATTDHITTIEPVFNDSALNRHITSPPTKENTIRVIAHQKSHPPGTEVRPGSVREETPVSLEKQTLVKSFLPSAGSSGSLVCSVHNQPSKSDAPTVPTATLAVPDVTCTAAADTEPVLTKSLFEEQKCVSSVPIKAEIPTSNCESINKVALLSGSCSYSSHLTAPDVRPEEKSKSNAKAARDNLNDEAETPTKTINLLEYARNATTTEEKPPEVTSPAASSAPSLWWKKTSPVNSQSGPAKRRTASADPNFVPDSEQQCCMWKKSPGGMTSVKVRLTRQSLIEGLRKSSKNSTRIAISDDDSGAKVDDPDSKKSTPSRCSKNGKKSPLASSSKAPEDADSSSAEGRFGERLEPAQGVVLRSRRWSHQERERSTSVTRSTTRSSKNKESGEKATLGHSATESERSTIENSSPVTRRSSSGGKSENSPIITLTSPVKCTDERSDRRLRSRRLFARDPGSPCSTPTSARLRSKSCDVTEAKTSSNSDSASFKSPVRSGVNLRSRRFSSASERSKNPPAPPSVEERRSSLPVTRPVDSVIGSDSDLPLSAQRRYPKRDTYLCLKSFSGLSPSYALASYSRSEAEADREVSVKRKSRKSVAVGKSDDKKRARESVLAPSVVDSSRDRRQLRSLSIRITDERTRGNVVAADESDEPAADEKTCDESDALHECAKKADNNLDSTDSGSTSNEVTGTSGATGSCSHADQSYCENDSASIVVEDFMDSLLSKVVGMIADEEREQLPTEESVDAAATATACNQSSACDELAALAETGPSVPALHVDDEIETPRGVDANDIVRITSHASHDLNSTITSEKAVDLPPVADLPTASSLAASGPPESATNDQSPIEIFRGGETDQTATDLGEPRDCSVTASPCDKPQNLRPPAESEGVSPLPLQEMPVPDQPLVSPVIDIPDQMVSPVVDDAIESMKNDFLSTAECPVLNADEVKSLLEAPDPPKLPDPVVNPYIVHAAPVICHPAPYLVAPVVNSLMSPPAVAACSGLPPASARAAPKLQSPVSRGTSQIAADLRDGAISGCFLPTHARHNDPLMQTPTPAPDLCCELVGDATRPSTNNSHAISPLSYSVRVTMAMADAISNNDLTSQPFRRSTPNPAANLESVPCRKDQTLSRAQSLIDHPSGLTGVLQDASQVTIGSSSPAQTTVMRAPQSGPLDALEQMINFYSAKNNLTLEEKEIVRSIINQQIQTNKLPMPVPRALDKPVGSPNPAMAEKKGPVPESQPRSKKRPSQQDKEKREGKTKRKRKDKDKHAELKQDIDAPWSVHPDTSSKDGPSCLLQIYQKRRSVAKSHKQSVVKALSMYNIFLGDKRTNKKHRLPPPPSGSLSSTQHQTYPVYEIKSDDGYYAKGSDLKELINQLLSSVHECRSTSRDFNPSSALSSVITPLGFLGLSHDAVRFLVEQLPGARHCHRYRAKYHKYKKPADEVTHINPHGCCRAEKYKGRSKPDMFSFLASKYRLPPEFVPDRHQDDDMLQLSNRRATSTELPMAMRFRHLRTFAREAVGVYRSSIHGRGLFCKRGVETGEMIMEYTGEMIRKDLTDKREKFYESKGIGCYMFRMDDMYVVDATMRGSSARFINHSCEPNCYSRIVQVEGKKHIVIFALRKIYRGEELTYDYKFPIEDEMHKITCNCGSRLCRKFMN